MTGQICIEIQWESCSEDLIEIVKSCLRGDPETRPLAKELLANKYY